MQTPSVGRIVHYHDFSMGVGSDGPYPAIITYVRAADLVDLQVFPLSMHGQRVVESVPLVETRPEGVNVFAVWPERV